jgi:hypothetical protein
VKPILILGQEQIYLYLLTIILIARQIKETMLPGGIVFIVNHDGWAEKLSDFLLVRSDLEKEVKRYSLFKGEDVRVYENI